MQFKDFVNWCFYGLLGFFAFQMVGNISDMRKSVELLNVNMAVVVDRVTRQKEDIYNLQGRVSLLETIKKQ